jgi:hypothetical protein
MGESYEKYAGRMDAVKEAMFRAYNSDALGIADHAMALLVQRHGVDGMKLDSKR